MRRPQIASQDLLRLELRCDGCGELKNVVDLSNVPLIADQVTKIQREKAAKAGESRPGRMRIDAADMPRIRDVVMRSKASWEWQVRNGAKTTCLTCGITWDLVPDPNSPVGISPKARKKVSGSSAPAATTDP